MKKLTLLIFLSCLLSDSVVEACVEFSYRSVGNSAISIYKQADGSRIELCVRPTIKIKNTKGVKFFGIRIPEYFNVRVAGAHRVIKLGVGKVVAFDYTPARKRYCIEILPGTGMKIWKYNKKIGDHVQVTLSKKNTLKRYYSFLNNTNHTYALATVIRKNMAAGMTVGSEYVKGSSGAKGGCGHSDVAWKKRPKPVAKRSDFE